MSSSLSSSYSRASSSSSRTSVSGSIIFRHIGPSGSNNLSSEIIEFTTSPIVMAVCFFSAFSRFLISHQSSKNVKTDATLIPQQTPTYLYLKASMSYSKHLPPASPSQVDFHNKQVESITLPNKIGDGIYPKSLKMTN